MAVRRGEDALLALRDLLGHSSLTTTVKYIHRVEMEGEVFQAAMAVNDLYEQHVQGHS
jgi:site-specific recombinase XerD